MKTKRIYMVLLIGILLAAVVPLGVTNAEASSETVIFQEGFESGWDDWTADNGVWEIGTPTAGPDSSHGGSQCAGTRLSGDYPANIDSRLISSPVTLPGVSGDEEILLRFWQWFSYADDEGYVQVSVYSGGLWGAWKMWGIQYNTPLHTGQCLTGI